MRVRCSEIQWDTSDTEGTIPKLPKTVTFTVPDLRENEVQELLSDELGELLSNKTGFCVLGFNHRILRPTLRQALSAQVDLLNGKKKT